MLRGLRYEGERMWGEHTAIRLWERITTWLKGSWGHATTSLGEHITFHGPARQGDHGLHTWEAWLHASAPSL